jgi:hypothetical protein
VGALSRSTVIGRVAGDTDRLAHDFAREVAERAAADIAGLGTRHAPQALAIDRWGARML